jgi:hypothetical protein
MFQNDAKIKGMLNPDVKFGVDVNNTTLATVADCEVFKNKLVFVSSSSSALCFVVVRCCLFSLSLVYDVVKAWTDRRGGRTYIC